MKKETVLNVRLVEQTLTFLMLVRKGRKLECLR